MKEQKESQFDSTHNFQFVPIKIDICVLEKLLDFVKIQLPILRLVSSIEGNFEHFRFDAHLFERVEFMFDQPSNVQHIQSVESEVDAYDGYLRTV